MTFNVIRVSVAALALMTFGSLAVAQENPARLAALAREARTAGDHADVAKRYRVQAEALEKKAAEHEAKAEQFAKNAPAIAHKWPSMAPQTVKIAKQEAVEARRAARESRELASYHQSMAVEALASAQ